MKNLGGIAAALLCSVALSACGGGDSPSTGGGGTPTPSPTSSPSPTPSPSPASYTKFQDIAVPVAFETACFTADPFEAGSMPTLFGPQGFGQASALSYDGSDLSVAIKGVNGVTQSWTGDQRANLTTGWGPDEDQYHWSKPHPTSSDRERLTMFVPYYGAVGGFQLNRYSRAITAKIRGAGTILSQTWCAAGVQTAAGDFPSGTKTYPDTDVSWGDMWARDGSGQPELDRFWLTDFSNFALEADFATNTVNLDITFAKASGETFGPYTGTGTIGSKGEISADLATADGTLMIRGSFFGPDASEYVVIYGLAEDTNGDGENDLVFIGPVGARE